MASPQVACLAACAHVKCFQSPGKLGPFGNQHGIAKLTFFRYYMRMTVPHRTRYGLSQFVGFVPQ